jgi:hypothetical protein
VRHARPAARAALTDRAAIAEPGADGLSALSWPARAEPKSRPTRPGPAPTWPGAARISHRRPGAAVFISTWHDLPHRSNHSSGAAFCPKRSTRRADTKHSGGSVVKKISSRCLMAAISCAILTFSCVAHDETDDAKATESILAEQGTNGFLAAYITGGKVENDQTIDGQKASLDLQQSVSTCDIGAFDFRAVRGLTSATTSYCTNGQRLYVKRYHLIDYYTNGRILDSATSSPAPVYNCGPISSDPYCSSVCYQ